MLRDYEGIKSKPQEFVKKNSLGKGRPVSNQIRRLWDEILNACGKREFVEEVPHFFLELSRPKNGFEGNTKSHLQWAVETCDDFR